MATGKIANLPREIREELNYQLYEGKSGADIVAWLNAKPEVLEVMNAHFEGRPVSEQNLSEWKKYGYQQWLTFNTLLNESVGASESAEAIAESGINCERLLVLLTARYADLIQRWNLIPTDQLNYKMSVFKQLTDAVLALRRAELQAVRLQLARERLDLLRERKRGKSDAPSNPSHSSIDVTRTAVPSEPSIPASDQRTDEQPELSGSSTSTVDFTNAASPSDVDSTVRIASIQAAQACKAIAEAPPISIALSATVNSADLPEVAEHSTGQISGHSMAVIAPAAPLTPPFRDPRSRYSLL